MIYNFSYIYPEMDGITRREAAVERLLDKPLSYQVFENAYLLPSKNSWANGKCLGGVVTKDLEFIESSAWHEGKRCDKYDFVVSEAKTDYATVIYMGFYNKIWGHVITDNLKKLWFLETEYCKQLIKEGARLIYITMDNEPMPSYVLRLFELAGVNLSQFVQVKELTQYSKIVIPDNSFVADEGQRLFTKEYKSIIGKIKSSVSSNIAIEDKIYYTRTQIKGERDFGEKSIENVFRNLGYTIIAPETKTIDEQIVLLSNCKAFAATEGSISHNAIFCQPGTETTIVRKCNDVNKYQMACNQVADLNVTYIDAHKSIRASKDAPWEGPFFLYVNKNFDKCFNLSSIHLYYWLHLDWWRYKMSDSYLYKRIKNKLCKYCQD